MIVPGLCVKVSSWGGEDASQMHLPKPVSALTTERQQGKALRPQPYQTLTCIK